MPKIDRTWRFALAASAETHGFLVLLSTDEGVGGAAYTSVSEHIGAGHGLVEHGLNQLRTVVLGRDPLNVAGCLEALAACGPINQALAGYDLALHDLAARALGIPLYRLLGGKVRDDIPVLRILAIKTPAEMAEVAASLVAEGYRYLKIKVEGDPDVDAARVRAIRERVGPKVHLTIDANQSYSVERAIRAIGLMEPWHIELVEQPVRFDDLDGLRAVARAVETPVEADESARTVDDVYRLVSGGIVDSISLKLPKLGGLRNAQAAAAICRAGGVGCRMGAAVGSRLLAAAGLHLMAASPAIGYACELGEFARLQGDPAAGLEVEHGTLRVPEGPGVGVRITERVEAHS
jgi:L-alanine-DL-glutamate epimerase-like enolase superfamily enzyme